MQLRELTDRYQLQKILKSTRFGTVLRATDTQSGATVVVKLVTVGTSPGLAAGAPEFTQLATTLAGLKHPHLPAVLDFGFTTDGGAFLVLELLAGKGLDTLSGAAPGEVVSLVGQALDGLEAMASHGIAHHNVSPDNILIVPLPAGDQVKLLGLGTAVFRPHGAAATAVGAENARFRAPELAAGGPADWRADLFSLALTACQALGATVGFGDPPVVQLPLAVSFELDNDEALRQGLERALRQRPGERPTPRELRQALRLAAGAAWAPAAPELRPVAVTPPVPPPATVMPFRPPSPAQPAASQTPPVIPDAWAPAMAPPPAAALSAAAPAPSAAPELFMPDPDPATVAEEPEEVLSAVDDEVLNALLSVPSPPPRPPGTRGEEAAGNVVAFQGPPTVGPADHAPAVVAGKVSLLRRPAVLAAIAGALLLAALATFWLLRSRPPQTVAAPPPPPVVLPTLPSQPPVAELAAARLHLAQGEDLQARRVLHAIAFGEQGLLSPAECRELGAIEETLARAAWERLPADLARGLETGDLELLQAAVEAGSGQDAGLAPEIRANLDRAREAVEAYARARAAAAQGDPVQALERYSALMTVLPKASDPEDLRGKAAQALETQAEALVKEARYAEALARLGPVQRTWPDRDGLKERIARYDTYQQNEQAQASLLATLPGVERRKRPWDALQMLNEVEPTPHLAPQFAAARARLENLLAQLDKAPPQVVLRDGYLLEYARGTVAELSFRVTDDYEVKEVKLMARREGGKFQDLPPEKSRSGYYTVALTPDFHQNGLVEIYVVASDLSGHEGHLGSSDQPLQLKRKQGFERLIR